MSALVSSPAVLIPADTPISACVRRMNERKIGSVLVIRDNEHYPEHNYRSDGRIELVGIFTERDLLRHAEELQRGGYWELPVSGVMTKNVVTIPLLETHRAGQLMLEHGFRHLPVVNEAGGKQEIIGLISMRDLFREQLEAQERLEESPEERQEIPPPSIAVLTRLEGDLAVLRAGLLSGLDADLKRVDPSELLEGAGVPAGCDFLLVDVERQDPQAWPSLLKKINTGEPPPTAIVLFDPLAHEPRTTAILDRINDARKFAVFHKPVNLVELGWRLRSSRQAG